MEQNKKLNDLLKWSIQNSAAGQANPDGGPAANGTTSQAPATNLTPDALAALFGGPSDAELMKDSMHVITSTDPEVSLDDKVTAFDNFEQLVEQLDNANNLAALSLWTPLLSMLSSKEPRLRLMAAWSVGTAVQNNQPSQERLLAMGGIPRLVELATGKEEGADVRRKAIYALSSAVRNYQPAMDACSEALDKVGVTSSEKVDATNMDAVDEVMNTLKEGALKA